jgi:CRISPR-associated protein (TIGR02584 family)
MRRRILIVTGGMSPAIVTETLWALAAAREPAFWPDRVFVVVTAGAMERCRTSLLGPARKLELLSSELKRPSLASATEIVSTDCTDIRSEEDAIAFGDAVCEVVQRETRDEHAIVHLSLAGGRKTMSFHGGAAMTLFGRPQDELSHVLVHPAALERQEADFWWPGHNQAGDVKLSLIPFVRVRGRLARTMLEQKMDYARYVAQVNAWCWSCWPTPRRCASPASRLRSGWSRRTSSSTACWRSGPRRACAVRARAASVPSTADGSRSTC